MIFNSIIDSRHILYFQFSFVIFLSRITRKIPVYIYFNFIKVYKHIKFFNFILLNYIIS